MFPSHDHVGGGGAIAANPNSNSEIGGRTYFLGCFMSESNGSTIFSDAGIQKTAITKIQATATLTIPKETDGDSGDNSEVALSISDINGIYIIKCYCIRG